MSGLSRGASIALLALALTAGSGRAQVQFGVAGGLTVPNGDALADYSTGFHGMVMLRFKPLGLPISLQFDGMFSRVEVDRSITSLDLKYQVISGTLNGVWEFPGSHVRPYVIGGFGLYNQDLKGSDVFPERAAQTDFGISGGLGIDFLISSTSLFAEARIHKLFGDDPDDPAIIPITVGVRLQGRK